MSGELVLIEKCSCGRAFVPKEKARGRRKTHCCRRCYMRDYMAQLRKGDTRTVLFKRCSECPKVIRVTSRTVKRMTCSPKCKKRRQRRRGTKHMQAA